MTYYKSLMKKHSISWIKCLCLSKYIAIVVEFIAAKFYPQNLCSYLYFVVVVGSPTTLPPLDALKVCLCVCVCVLGGGGEFCSRNPYNKFCFVLTLLYSLNLIYRPIKYNKKGKFTMSRPKCFTIWKEILINTLFYMRGFDYLVYIIIIMCDFYGK